MFTHGKRIRISQEELAVLGWIFRKGLITEDEQGEDDSIEEVLSLEEEAKDESPDYKKMPLAERVAILPKPTEDVMEELRMYEKRMGYDKDTMRSMRYKMDVYDEFLEEYEARKKQWGTEKIENYKKIKERGER